MVRYTLCKYNENLVSIESFALPQSQRVLISFDMVVECSTMRATAKIQAPPPDDIMQACNQCWFKLNTADSAQPRNLSIITRPFSLGSGYETNLSHPPPFLSAMRETLHNSRCSGRQPLPVPTKCPSPYSPSCRNLRRIVSYFPMGGYQLGRSRCHGCCANICTTL